MSEKSTHPVTRAILGIAALSAIAVLGNILVSSFGIGHRGVDFTESDLPKVEDTPKEKPRRSPTAHWAAFVFSGTLPPP